MDWPPKFDPFISPNSLDLFEYGVRCRGKNQKTTVIQNWDVEKDAEIIPLLDAEDWETWIQSLGHIPRQHIKETGFSILCIPQVEDVSLRGGSRPSEYTDLPLDEAQWRRIAKAFHLPGHFPKLVERRQTSVTSIVRTHKFEDDEELWMHTAVINPDFCDFRENSNFRENPFAIAATHFEKRKLTFAVMFSCSDDQIDRIQGLVNTWKDAIGHPLLMLGIYAELQLSRLIGLVGFRYRKYTELKENVEREAALIAKDRFSWGMIGEVGKYREESKKVEEEVATTKLQLSKARSSALQMLKDRRYNDSDEMAETTNLFSERFNDIDISLDGLGAKCRIIVEGISFTTDIIRSELSRQEAQTSAENSKIATGISLVAMIYLPLTTMATIFAMPIFQWSNDWRDWRYRPVDSGNTSSSDSSSGNSLDEGASPVISGYIWIYLSVSLGLTLITYFIFRLYMRFRDGDLPILNPTTAGARGSRETLRFRDNTSTSPPSLHYLPSLSAQLGPTQDSSTMLVRTHVNSQVGVSIRAGSQTGVSKGKGRELPEASDTRAPDQIAEEEKTIGL